MSAGVLLPSVADSALAGESTVEKRGRRRVRSPVVPATSGDHAAVYFFLSDVFQGPTRAEFKASLEDPCYRPLDRLLLRRGGQIIAHVHLTHRVMQFGRVQVPIAGLDWLGVAANCQGQGLGSHLLAAAEKQLARSGALVAWLRTGSPYFFRRAGWAVCGRHSYSRAGAHAVLARLLDHGLRYSRHPRLHIRPWRRWEERALVRIYNQNLAGRYGPLERTPAYWQWLVRRQAYDQLYVALDGPDLWDLKETSTPIVGYLAIKGERIVELMTAPGRRKAAIELVARACGDAIEHDRRSIVLHAPSTSRMFDIFDEAGGRRYHHEADPAGVYMARVLAPVELLRRLGDDLFRRAEEAGLPYPLELGLLVDGRKYQLEITRRRVVVAAQHVGRSYLRMNVADFTRLVLGQLDWDRAMAERRIEASTALALETGRALFPRLPFWRPPLDELMV
jgi:predicted N-acetyltransferase YhbS